MKKRRLGSTGPFVSSIGIGAMSFTNFYGPTSEMNSFNILKTALDLGIDHIDTANVYGMGLSEAVIGKFLAKQGKQKQNFFKIATKAAVTKDSKTGERAFDNSWDHLEDELEKSLQRLGLETIEMLYIHRRDPNIPIEEVTGTLSDFVGKGKIKRFGFSEISPSSLIRASMIHEVAAVQSEYSLSVRSPELGLVQQTLKSGSALVAFSPVGRGLLTDSPPSTKKIKDVDFLRENPRFCEPNLSANIALIKRFQNFAAEKKTSAAALSIAWLLSRGEHIIPIPGTRSVKHLKELASGVSLTLSNEDLQKLEEILPVGWAHGDRYSARQWIGPERYC